MRPFWVLFLTPIFMSKTFVFSSESVGEGHPDKAADLISDSVLDACLAQDKFSRVACETMVKSNQVVIAGEDHHARQAQPLLHRARRHPRHRGYVNSDACFTPTRFFVTNLLTRQSPGHFAGRRCGEGQGQEKGGTGCRATKASCLATPVTKRASSCPLRSCLPTASAAS